MKKFYLLILICLLVSPVKAEKHPYILVQEKDKKEILDKISNTTWAKTIFENIKEELAVYVERHQTNPNWILDRYLMNRVPGKRYTHFTSDMGGTQLIEYHGDAPSPTIRVSPHKRGPVTPEGQHYVAPKIEDIIPKDTSMKMNLFNPVTKSYELIDPQAFVGGVNGRINRLAYEASVIYWLTDDERYAKFAADILNQWVNAAIYQYPIEGPGRVGFLNIQTLGDGISKDMILAYDFLYTYLCKNKYSLKNYEAVFERIAWTLAFRGYVGNNWFAAESSTLVSAALSLQDRSKRDYYLSFYLSRDTIVNGCGQLSLPSAMKTWFTPDGHWKEPGGYHNYPVSNLIESAMMLENNGYEIFNKYPGLLKSAYVMSKYSFPNLTASAFGDTGRPRQNINCLEIGIKMAQKYKLPVLADLVDVVKIMEHEGLYDRSKTGVMGLLCYLSDLPEASEYSGNLWNRTEKLDFASCYLQRNGMDKKTGLMSVVQGATYNHNHSNGMSMELYGAGTVMGIDPGNGPTYEHPLHVFYYTQWGAHNTVVAGGASYSLQPFRGSGAAKQIGAVKLESMEPLAGEKALSENLSYTYTKYYEGFTKTNQERLLSIFRLDSVFGFYVDIYRSDNTERNDYLYHNIGDKVELFDSEGNPLPMNSLPLYPTVGEDHPGFRYYKSVKTTGEYTGAVSALFSAEKLESGKGYMKMWMPATPDFCYYTALSPQGGTAEPPYSSLLLPTVTVQTKKDASKIPFMVVYEPILNSPSNSRITSVERLTNTSQSLSSAIKVRLKDGGTCTFINSKEISEYDSYKRCKADFGVFIQMKSKTILYMGNGSLVENEDFIVETVNSKNGFAVIEYDNHSVVIRSNDLLKITVKNSKLRKKMKIKNNVVELDGIKTYVF